MSKKSSSILVPLVPKAPKGDVPNEFRPNFNEFTVGAVTVKIVEKYPGTLRFENDVPLKIEAMVEEDVFETLMALCEMNRSTGYLVTVDFGKANTTSHRNKKGTKTGSPLRAVLIAGF